jgi:formamidopyrimidine-DNA glycosylase
MPEIIEIRKYADFLKSKIKNQYLNQIRIRKGRYKTHGPFDLYSKINRKLPLKIIDIKTKGKFLYMHLENNYYIFSTLGLHGGWTWLKSSVDANSKTKSKYNYKDGSKFESKFEFCEMLDYVPDNQLSSYYKTALNNLNVQFIFDHGSLFYFDSLSFGTIKIINEYDKLTEKLDSIGPDIMEVSTTFDIFCNRIQIDRNLDKPIGIILLDQKIISGVGNYLRADVLWLSKISPFRKVKNLSNPDLKLIYHNLKLLTWGDYDYEQAIQLRIIKKDSILPFYFGLDFFVYNSTTDIYDNPVIKEELYNGSQKRFIYWVKQIQK